MATKNNLIEFQNSDWWEDQERERLVREKALEAFLNRQERGADLSGPVNVLRAMEMTWDAEFVENFNALMACYDRMGEIK